MHRLAPLFFLLFWIGVEGEKATAQNALPPHRQLTQFMLDNWTIADGLPTNTLLHLCQTNDGYLWISTYEGLIRFDGLDFKVFNKSNTPAFQSDTFTEMLQDSSGTLWIGSYGSGLIAYQADTFRVYPFRPLIKSLLRDTQTGQLWIGTAQQGIFIFDGEMFRPALFEPLRDVRVLTLAQDPTTQTIWIGTAGNGLIRYQNGQYTQDLRAGKVISAILPSSDGKLWIGTEKGLVINDKENYQIPSLLEGFVINRLLEDATGTVWISTWDGLFRKRSNDSSFELLDEARGLPHGNTTDLLVTTDGSLWIGTYWGGLCRLQDSHFLNYTEKEGLSSAIPLSICAYGKDRFLIGTDQGEIFESYQNKIKSFPTKDQNLRMVRHLLTDNKNNLWVSHFDGLLRIDPNGNETTLKSGRDLPRGMVRQTLQASDGRLWIASMNGLAVLNPATNAIATISALDQTPTLCLAEDETGRIWVGSNGNGLYCIDPQTLKILQQYKPSDGLPSDIVLNLHYEPSTQTLWVACNGGLSRYQNGNFFNFSTQHGLPTSTPFDFLPDRLGNAWIPNGRGVWRVALSDLQAIAEGEQTHTQGRLFDRRDGIAEYSGPNKAFRDPDGQLWFPTIKGVSRLDPAALTIRPLAPPVRITQLIADGKSYAPGEEIDLSAGVQRIAIHYTALNLRDPYKTRFRVQVQGFDPQWIETDKARVASYTNLPAGEHRFAVMAANSDGIWGDTSAELSFYIRQHFYQTWWFWAATGLVLLGIFGAFYRWRLYAIGQRNQFLERQVKKRTLELEEKNYQIEKKNNAILGSLQYAQRIQRAVMPRAERVSELLPRAWVWLQPRDIVSGDFYWVSQRDHKVVLVAADCTGHGVPGAFMSVLGMELLENIVNKRGILQAGPILDTLHEAVQKALQQGERRVEDGMDVSLCVIDLRLGRLEFAGAKNPLIWIEEGQLKEVPGDRMSIGGFKYDKKAKRKAFQTHSIPLCSPSGIPSSFYLFSDGMPDQFGGPEGRKLMKKRLKKHLLHIHQQNIQDQQAATQKLFQDWKGNSPQTDDVLLVGFAGKTPI